MQEAQQVDRGQCPCEEESEHDEEEDDGGEAQQALLLHGIDEPARERAAEDGADLEGGHRHARLEIAACECLRDDDRQGGDHDVL